MGAVGKVDAEYVNPFMDHLFQYLPPVCGRPDGCHYLGVGSVMSHEGSFAE
jgi:hypothetical protein